MTAAWVRARRGPACGPDADPARPSGREPRSALSPWRSVASALAGCANSAGTRPGPPGVPPRRAVARPLPGVAARNEPMSARGRRSDRRPWPQLRDAPPPGRQAAGQAGQWQALMATLAESDRLPESDLVHALRAQCAAVDSNAGGAPTGDASPAPQPDPATRPAPIGL